MKLTILLLCAATGFAQLPPKLTLNVPLTNTPSAAAIKEMTMMVRLVGGGGVDASYEEAYNSFSLTGYKNQLGLAAWLLRSVDKTAETNEYVAQPDVPFDRRESVTRVRYLRNSEARDIPEILTAMRVVGTIQRVYAVSGPVMFAFGGTTAEAELGDWMITNLDVHEGAGYSSFTMPRLKDGTEDVARIFFLNKGTSQKTTSELMKTIRETTSTKAVFWKTAPPAIVMRGTPAALSQAQQLIASAQ